MWQFLLPAYVQKSEHYSNKVKKELAGIVTDQNRETIERGIKLGIERADRKWDRREGIYKHNNIGSHRTEEIGLLKRGELVAIEGQPITVSKHINKTREVFKILSHAIYGSGRYKKLIVRNLWKFIQLHEKDEKRSFKPFLGKLSNNTTKWIHTWNMFCALIKNRDLDITTYELEIISRLYDVRIKIFRNHNSTFKCTWYSQYNTSREVKFKSSDFLF